MKLSEIEAVSPDDFVVFDKEDGMPYSYVIDRWYKTGAKEVDNFPKFYTPEQMQEYAKEAIRGFAAHISLYETGEDWPNTVAENFIKKEFEDTKND
jgi:hypothetical protein